MVSGTFIDAQCFHFNFYFDPKIIMVLLNNLKQLLPSAACVYLTYRK